MGTPRQHPRRIGRRDADRWLSGGSADADRPELARVLSAVSGPALSDELADESAAIALFGRQYELGRTDAAERLPAPRRGTAAARGRPLRLAVALAALVFGGLATGAETGLLPAALQRPAHNLFSGLGVPPVGSGSPGSRTSASPSPVPHASSSGRHQAPGTSATESAAAGALILCHAYQDGTLVRGSAEFAELRTAAGGTGKIEAYCAALLSAASAQPGDAATAGTDQTSQPGNSGNSGKTHGPPSPKASLD